MTRLSRADAEERSEADGCNDDVHDQEWHNGRGLCGVFVGTAGPDSDVWDERKRESRGNDAAEDRDGGREEGVESHAGKGGADDADGREGDDLHVPHLDASPAPLSLRGDAFRVKRKPVQPQTL